MYKGIIGSLLHLTIRGLDIVFSISMCEKFQSFPKESYLKVAKRNLGYIKGTPNLVLFHPSGDNFDLRGIC